MELSFRLRSYKCSSVAPKKLIRGTPTSLSINSSTDPAAQIPRNSITHPRARLSLICSENMELYCLLWSFLTIACPPLPSLSSPSFTCPSLSFPSPSAPLPFHPLPPLPFPTLPSPSLPFPPLPPPSLPFPSLLAPTLPRPSLPVPFLTLTPFSDPPRDISDP